MTLTTMRAAQITAFSLIAVVVTQLVYFGLNAGGVEFESSNIWFFEAIAFLAMALGALVLMVRSQAAQTAAAAIALGGVLNAIQVGMGMAMFGPVSDAGEAMAPAYQAILAGAFWLYFAGKILFGLAGILLGLFLLKNAGGVAKSLGVVAVVTGLGALVVNTVALKAGLSMVFPAGATGTAATLFAALALLAAVRREGEG